MDDQDEFVNEEGQVSVLLKLSETAVACNTCKFTFIYPENQEITGFSDEIDSDNNR